MAEEHDSLRKRALHAAAWGYAGMAGKLLIQLGSQVVLARLLGPQVYGLFAIGSIVIGLTNFFADAGIGAVIVQRATLDDALIVFVQTFQWLTGLAAFAALLLLAPWIASFFNEPRATVVIRGLAVVCLLSAMSSVPSNLLRRKLDFKPIQVAQVSGFFVGYVVVGVPAALAGQGVWSLVEAWVVQASVNCALLFRAARPPVGLRLRLEGGQEALAFGANALVSNISTWAATSADKLVVGRFFTSFDLGLYNVASNLLSTAVQQVLSTLQSVVFSASSRHSSDLTKVRDSFLGLFELGSLLLLSLFASIAVVPGLVLLTVYGPKWSAGASFLSPISVTMASYGIAGMVTPLLWSMGKVKIEGRIQAVGAVTLLVVCSAVAVSTGSVQAVAWAAAACTVVRASVTVACVAHYGSVSPVQVLDILSRTFAVALGTSVGVYLGSHAATWAGARPWLALASGAALGIAAFGAGLALACRGGRLPTCARLFRAAPGLRRLAAANRPEEVKATIGAPP